MFGAGTAIHTIHRIHKERKRTKKKEMTTTTIFLSKLPLNPWFLPLIIIGLLFMIPYNYLIIFSSTASLKSQAVPSSLHLFFKPFNILSLS